VLEELLCVLWREIPRVNCLQIQTLEKVVMWMVTEHMNRRLAN